MSSDVPSINSIHLVERAVLSRDPEALLRDRAEEILAGVELLSTRAIAGDPHCQLSLHRALYRINIACFALPWQHAGLHPEHPVIAASRYTMETVWERSDRTRHADELEHLPQPEDFPGWIRTLVQSHASNVSHPLFTFLRDQASYAQLRHFFLQETPFDIFFGDILTLMMPGIYGSAKVELCRNFWDEMGHADGARMHRSLRLKMMAALNIPLDHHLNRIEDYCVEELRLANMYFDAVRNRRKLPQAIGMMLATELMVPGRLDYQIAGWRRVGLSEDDLTYLVEHTIIDVEHADGWMSNVVMPLLTEHASLMAEIVLGVLRRLNNAGAVCDRFYSTFTA